MNTQQIQMIKALDPNGLDGSIQSLLLRPDIATITFEAALKFLVQALMNDKASLWRENCKMSAILKSLGKYHLILED